MSHTLICVLRFKVNTKLSIIIHFTSKTFSMQIPATQYHCYILLCLWLLWPKRKLASSNLREKKQTIKKRSYGAIYIYIKSETKRIIGNSFFCFDYLSSICISVNLSPPYLLTHCFILYRTGNEKPLSVHWKEAWNILFTYARKWKLCILPKTWNKVFQVQIHTKNRLQ